MQKSLIIRGLLPAVNENVVMRSIVIICKLMARYLLFCILHKSFPWTTNSIDAALWMLCPPSPQMDVHYKGFKILCRAPLPRVSTIWPPMTKSPRPSSSVFAYLLQSDQRLEVGTAREWGYTDHTQYIWPFWGSHVQKLLPKGVE